jgi:hypothetical protein
MIVRIFEDGIKGNSNVAPGKVKVFLCLGN